MRRFFEPILVDLSDEKSSAALRSLWPMAKFPVLRDEARNRTVAEATVIVEYLGAYYPGGTQFVPAEADLAWQTRMWDRFYDHVHLQMQKIVGDWLRPSGAADPFGVEHAKTTLQRAYEMIEHAMDGKTWAVGKTSAWPTVPPHLRCSTRTRPCPSVGAAESTGLFGPLDVAAFLCASAQGSAAVFRHVPDENKTSAGQGETVMQDQATQAASKDFVISRVFDAPRDLVWQCFTDPERMKQWWGPKDAKVIKSDMDLRVGGTYLYGMEMPDGKAMWGIRLPRNHSAGKTGFHQFVFRRSRRRDASSDGAELAAAVAVDVHL